MMDSMFRQLAADETLVPPNFRTTQSLPEDVMTALRTQSSSS